MDTLGRHEEKLNAHDEHSRDMNIHWTPRERDDHSKKLDRIEELIRELLTDRANVFKAIEHALGRGGNSKPDKA
jgi:hypothetical protein